MQFPIVRFSKENPNWEKALEGKWGGLGEEWGYFGLLKNILLVVLYKGANVSDYQLPEVYDGFLVCSDGTMLPIVDSKLNAALGEDVSAQGILKLTKDN